MPLSPATLSAAQLRSVVVEGEPDAQNRPAASAESFGARLQRLRTAKGLTQGQLAVRLGVSEPSISAWELDKARPKAGARKSVVEGKSVSVRVDLGGRRIIKKKKTQRYVNRLFRTIAQRIISKTARTT